MSSSARLFFHPSYYISLLLLVSALQLDFSRLVAWEAGSRALVRTLVVRTGTAMMDGSSGQQQHMDLFMRHHQGGIGIGMGMGMGMGLGRCEIEEDALGSSESEPAARQPRPRSKRTRAAEVHNLSEKRRRCKINEKMKALQSLVPNSSKTDKASMLDDAIEYLKQLQLQVQILSMRNGLYLPPVNLPGASGHLPESQMCAELAQNSIKAINHPVALLPVNQISGAQHSFDPPNHDPRHHNPLVLSSVPSRTTAEPQFVLDSSQPNLQSLMLTPSAEMILQKDVMLNHHLSSAQETTSVPVGHDMKPARQDTSVANADHFDRCSIWKKQSEDMMPNNTERVLFMPHLHRSQSGDGEAGLRAGSK